MYNKLKACLCIIHRSSHRSSYELQKTKKQNTTRRKKIKSTGNESWKLSQRRQGNKHSTSVATIGALTSDPDCGAFMKTTRAAWKPFFSTHSTATRLSLWTTQSEEMRDFMLMHKSEFISVQTDSDVRALEYLWEEE